SGAANGDNSTWTGFAADRDGVVWNQLVSPDGTTTYQRAEGGPTYISFSELDLTAPLPQSEAPPNTPVQAPPPAFQPDPPAASPPTPVSEAVAAGMAGLIAIPSTGWPADSPP